MATQSITEIASSPYCNLLLESCPAKVFLPNPEARGDHVRDSYLKLGLTRRQVEIVARATPRSQYYYTSPLGSRLFNLDLGPIALALCGSTAIPICGELASCSLRAAISYRRDSTNGVSQTQETTSSSIL